MDRASILGGIIIFLVLTIGLPLTLRQQKKNDPIYNVEQLLHHLQEIGVKASLTERGVAEEKVGASRSFRRRSESVIEIEGRDIDYINVSSIASQNGFNYFLDYLVRSPGQSEKSLQ